MNFVCFLSLDIHIYHYREKGKQQNEFFLNWKNKKHKKDVPLPPYEDGEIHIDISDLLGTCDND